MSDPIRSGDHELWDAYMATGARAQLDAIADVARRMSAAFQPIIAALTAAMRGLADAARHLPAAPVPEASPSRARAPGIPQKENDASDCT